MHLVGSSSHIESVRDLGAGSGSQNVRGQTYLSPRVLGFQVGDIGPLDLDPLPYRNSTAPPLTLKTVKMAIPIAGALVDSQSGSVEDDHRTRTHISDAKGN